MKGEEDREFSLIKGKSPPARGGVETVKMTLTATRTRNTKQPLSRNSKYERTLNVWPIRNARDYDRATKEMDALVVRPYESLSAEEKDRLEIFSRLIEAYDSEHYDIDTSSVTPIDLLKCLMEDHGMSDSDLGRLLGNRSMGCLIMSGRRELSKNHIRILSAHFKLSPEAFL
jgi:HTH-type transcriptional regulator/antitoxin HigA